MAEETKNTSAEVPVEKLEELNDDELKNVAGGKFDLDPLVWFKEGDRARRTERQKQ